MSQILSFNLFRPIVSSLILKFHLTEIKKKKGKRKRENETILCDKYILTNFKTMCNSYVI